MEKPRRPLNPYQRFFREERARVLGLGEAGLPATHASSHPDGGAEERTGKEAKRKHRKSHGKISFRELTRHVSQAWKNLDAVTKKAYQAEFKFLMAKFKEDMWQYEVGTSADPPAHQGSHSHDGRAGVKVAALEPNHQVSVSAVKIKRKTAAVEASIAQLPPAQTHRHHQVLQTYQHVQENQRTLLRSGGNSPNSRCSHGVALPATRAHPAYLRWRPHHQQVQHGSNLEHGLHTHENRLERHNSDSRGDFHNKKEDTAPLTWNDDGQQPPGPEQQEAVSYGGSFHTETQYPYWQGHANQHREPTGRAQCYARQGDHGDGSYKSSSYQQRFYEGVAPTMVPSSEDCMISPMKLTDYSAWPTGSVHHGQQQHDHQEYQNFYNPDPQQRRSRSAASGPMRCDNLPIMTRGGPIETE
jgi:hypothetical protein